MEREERSLGRAVAAGAGRLVGRAYSGAAGQLVATIGGRTRTRVVLLLAAVLGLSSADASTVGASATQLRHALHITNTDVGLLVAVSSLVGAAASLPFGVVADRVNRTRALGAVIVLWGAAMIWSATIGSFGQLLVARLALGAVTAAAGPLVASLVGDYFSGGERGRIYGFILAGELVGAGVGFAVTGDIAALSWRAAFVILALPAFALALAVWRLPEPKRGARPMLALPADDGGADDDEPRETDAQRLARERGVEFEPPELPPDPRRMGIIAATRYVLSVKTNVVLILASACGYYFLAGVQTFGIEFTTHQYHVSQPVANLLLLVVGAGAIAGVLLGGSAGDWLLRRGHLHARISVSTVAAAATTVLFVPAIFARSAGGALPYLMLAVLALSAQNPPLDAARLDIMPPLLWGRAEGVRTFLRTLAQALAPLLFGAISDYVFGGGRSGLQWTFAVMIAPLGLSAVLLARALPTYPRDVAAAAAAAAAAAERESGRKPDGDV